MGRTAILVDGLESEIREDVVVPIQGIGGRQTRWIGVGIGVLTAFVAMGALGSETRPPTAAPGLGESACVAVASARADEPRPATPAPTLHDWWSRAATFVWVDPATGLIRQHDRLRSEHAADGRPAR